MVRRAVVLRHGQVGRQRVDVDAHATPQTFIATSAYVSRGLHEPVDVEVLAQLDVHQARRGSVVHGRDAVAGQRGRVTEPASDVAARALAEDLLVRGVDRLHELVPLVDLGARRRDVDLALDAVAGEPVRQRADEVEHLAPCKAHRLRRRHAHVEEQVGVMRRP